MQSNADEKQALRALREAFSRVVRRDWVTEIPGLLPDVEAVLRLAGGPIEHVKMSETPAGERMGRQMLPGVCIRSLDKLGPAHAASGHLRSILYLIAAGYAPAPDSDPDPAGHEAHYSEESFWQKLAGFALSAGRSVVEMALQLFFVAIDKGTPAHIKALCLGPLGYFIFPFDAIPDIIPVVGYSDDLGVLALTLAAVASFLTPEIKERAREKADQWFGPRDDNAEPVPVPEAR